VAEGELNPTIDKRMPIAQAADALRLLVDGKVTGKIVLEA
jgi:NADPH:quinone reductase-like Zn-dependent oxidoreductase